MHARQRRAEGEKKTSCTKTQKACLCGKNLYLCRPVKSKAVSHQPYSIEVPKLRLGDNAFAFSLDTAFFTDSPLIEEAEVAVAAMVHKTEHLLDARFSFTGSITLNCDRCLQPYAQTLSVEHRIIYNFDQQVEADENDVEMVYINRNLHYLNWQQDFYDLICLQVPYRKVPCDNTDFACLADAQVLKALETPEPDPNDAPTDPRWEALKKLKNS